MATAIPGHVRGLLDQPCGAIVDRENCKQGLQLTVSLTKECRVLALGTKLAHLEPKEHFEAKILVNSVSTRSALLGLAALIGATFSFAQPAQAILHAFCVSPTPACLDNGTVTPTNTNPPSFGFATGGGGTFTSVLLEVLVPNNVKNAATQSITITGTTHPTTGAAGVVTTLTDTAAFSATAWPSAGNTNETLATYLGISSGNNKASAWLPSTDAVDPGANAYFVYQFAFPKETFGGNASGTPGQDPTFTTSYHFAVGTIIAAFACTTGTTKDPGKLTKIPGSPLLMTCDNTANSSVLFIHHRHPEPMTLSLVAGGAMAGAAALRRRKSRRVA